MDPKAEKNSKLKAIAEITTRKNEKVREALDSSASGSAFPKLDEIAQNIYQELSTNKVTTVNNVQKYETGDNIGFCFGRALMVHSRLLNRGVKQENIRKIFALGKLTYRQLYWDFHMATMVRGNGNSWVVIDNLFEKPLSHGEWMKRVREMDLGRDLGRTRFYVTDARKFQPAYGAYTVEHFGLPGLKGFFTDLFNSLN